MARNLLFVLIVFLVGIHGTTLAQNDNIYRPQWAIKANPLAILAHAHGIEMGLEHSLTDRTSIHIGGSYLNDFGLSQGKDFRGYKILSEYRIYSIFKRWHPNTFCAIHFNGKQTFTEGETFLNRANGNFQELVAFGVQNTTLAFLGSLGRVIKFSPVFSIDLSLAFGTKLLTVSSDDIPADAALISLEEGFLDFTVNELGTGLYPIFRIHCKLNFEW